MLIYPVTVKFQNLQPPFLATFKDFFYNVPIACFPIAAASSSPTLKGIQTVHVTV